MGDGEAVIREVWRRWNAGEREYNPEIIDPDIEIVSALTSQVFSGEEGLRRWVAEVNDQFATWRISIDRMERSADDRFVVLGSVRARGRQSGLDLDQQITWKVDLRDGRLLRVENILGWADE